MKKKKVFFAVILILVGLVYLAHNRELINTSHLDFLISWPTLLVVVGVYVLNRMHWLFGVISLFLAFVYILSGLDILPVSLLEVFWPIALVYVGLAILIKSLIGGKKIQSNPNEPPFNANAGNMKNSYLNSDGYIVSENTLGSVQQIVLSPVFKGARVKNILGGTVLDLRRTKLENAQAYIDLECTLGGVEIYIPDSWNILVQATCMVGGYTDKRYYTPAEIDMEHTLIVRGTIQFGGIEFKS